MYAEHTDTRVYTSRLIRHSLSSTLKLKESKTTNYKREMIVSQLNCAAVVACFSFVAFEATKFLSLSSCNTKFETYKKIYPNIRYGALEI